MNCTYEKIRIASTWNWFNLHNGRDWHVIVIKNIYAFHFLTYHTMSRIIVWFCTCAILTCFFSWWTQRPFTVLNSHCIQWNENIYLWKWTWTLFVGQIELIMLTNDCEFLIDSSWFKKKKNHKFDKFNPSCE